MLLLLEQLLNGLQFGVMLFLLAAGLTLVFGIMGVINLAHGSLFMVGAYAAAATAGRPARSRWRLLAGAGRRRRRRSRDRVPGHPPALRRATISTRCWRPSGCILFFNELMAILAGRTPLFMQPPAWLGGAVEIIPGVPYPTFRLAILATGLAVAGGLAFLIARTRLGMLIRAGATHRAIVRRAGRRHPAPVHAGVRAGRAAGRARRPDGGADPRRPGRHGRADPDPTFVVVVIGGLGSVRGAFVGALLVGLVDTLARAFLPGLLKQVFAATTADALGAGLASAAIYLLMALVLVFRPRGLLPV